MKQKVIKILKKHLNEGYKKYDDELEYITPYEILCEYPSNEKILEIATEIIVAIRSIDSVELFHLPEKEDARKWVKDNYPYGLGEYHIDFVSNSLLDWLRSL
jgi:hypothetical protein